MNITAGAGADANRGNADALGNHSCDLTRHNFQHNRESAGVFQRARVIEQLARGRRSLPLHAIGPELVDRLWRQSNVAHHCDLFIDQTPYQWYALVSAFKLDGFSAAFFYQPQSVSHCVVRSRMKEP